MKTKHVHVYLHTYWLRRLYEHSVVVGVCSVHYYKNFTGGGRFRFSVTGKAVHRGLEAMVNRGLTAAGGLARRG